METRLTDSTELPPSPPPPRGPDRSARMGTEPLGKLLMAFSGPAILAMASGALYNVVDAIFVGRLGSDALAGVTVAFPAMVGIMAFASGTGVGAASAISRALGAGDREGARRLSGNTLLLVVLWGALTPAVAFPLMDLILRLSGASETVLPLGREYFAILAATALVTFFVVVINHVIRAEGNAMLPMVAMIVSSLINIALDPLFIFTFDLGVRGAAWATVLSRLLGAVIQGAYLFSRRSELRPAVRHLLPDLGAWWEIYRTGAATVFRNGVQAALFALINSVAAGFGDLAVAAVGIILRLTSFVMMPVFGLNQGYLPIVGYNFGAGQLDRVRRVTLLGVGWATALTTVASGLFVVFPRFFVAPFAPDDPALEDLASRSLQLFCLALAPAGASVLLSAFFQGIGRGMPALVLSFARQLGFILPAVLILPRFLGLDGLFLAQPLSDVAAFVITIAWTLVQFRQLGIPVFRSGRPPPRS